MFSDWRHRCAAVIPCLNEAATIGPLVAQVKRSVELVIVVDDGSGDATARLAEDSGAQVLRHSIRTGKGQALREGWNLARERGCEWAICLDGDGQHDPSLIPAFFQKADQTAASLVAGNRMADAGKMPFVRRAVNRWMSAQLSRRAGRPLPDSQCGFRLMNLQAYGKVQIHSSHFEIESEILLAFIKAGLIVEFVPIPVIYGKETSKINPVTDTLRWFKWWRNNGRE
jgi:glycosyltransferase involved in cell wall biosynthesis